MKYKNDQDFSVGIEEFELHSIKYIARSNGKSYGEIVYAETGKKVENQKGLAREYLAPLGIKISTRADIINTYSSIKLLVEELEKQRAISSR